MSYVWVILLLLRIFWSVAQKDKTGSGSSAAPRGSRFGGVNLGVLVLYLLFVYPLVLTMLAALLMVNADLPSWAQWIAVPVVLAGGLFAVTLLPHWLAWRVLGPWRLAPLGRLFLAVALYRTAGDRAGARELHRARFGRDWDRCLPPASLWTIAGAALQAEDEGDAERADALLGALLRLPPKTRLPQRAIAVAAEGLAGAAAQRRDWEGASERAAAGRGRGTRFLRLAAAPHLGQPVSRSALLLAWALAPGRIAAFPLLSSALALAAPEAAGASLEPAAAAASEEAVDPAVRGPHLAHLLLLSRAAAGRPVETREVEALARAWSSTLTATAAAELLKRGLELGGQGLSDLPESIGGSIFAELELLAEVAEGEWSPEEEEFAGRLVRQRVDRAFADVEEEVAAFHREEAGHPSRQMTFPLKELERWLDFRARVEQLERLGGESALAAAWHNGLRTTACNWPVFLSRQQGGDAYWAAFLMHGWSADLAARLGDEEIAALSAKNAEGVRRHLP